MPSARTCNYDYKLRGLFNLGSTCYFNAFIQAFISIPGVQQFFLDLAKVMSTEDNWPGEQ